MKFIIIVDSVTDPITNQSALTSVTSDNIPANLRRHLELAISMALDFEAEAPKLIPQINVGGTSDEDRQRLNFLDALEAWGVDNWEGYSEAHKEAYPEEHEADEEVPAADEQEVA